MTKFNRKKKFAPKQVAELQPDEIGEVKKLISEYVRRRSVIEQELETLKDDKKALREEFEEKLDIKTLDLVEKQLKIQASLDHADTFELYLESLKNDDYTVTE